MCRWYQSPSILLIDNRSKINEFSFLYVYKSEFQVSLIFSVFAIFKTNQVKTNEAHEMKGFKQIQ